MFAFLARRLASIVPTLIVVSMLVFGLQLLLPGDPASMLAGEDRDEQSLAEIRAYYGLDRPIHEQYLRWIGGVLQGDFGTSLRIGQPVLELVLAKLPVTLQLGGMAFAIACLIGIPMGVLSAVRKDSAWDYAANAIALWGLSTPNFWLGIMLILLVSVELGWLPPSGYVSPFEDWKQSLATTIMPAFVLGNSIAAVFMRHTRAAMLQALNQDYVRTARAKGLAVLTEQVFTIPGFGKLVVDAVFNRDYLVVQGVVLVTATAYVGFNLLADIAYFLVNPRLRQQ
jgi:peptide/nickel transport system permease protein